MKRYIEIWNYLSEVTIFQWWSEGSRNSYTERNDCRHRNHLRYLRSLRNHRCLMLYQVRTFYERTFSGLLDPPNRCEYQTIILQQGRLRRARGGDIRNRRLQRDRRSNPQHQFEVRQLWFGAAWGPPLRQRFGQRPTTLGGHFSLGATHLRRLFCSHTQVTY